MKKLYDYILEASLSKADWDKMKYINPVINALCNKDVIRCGSRGEKEVAITDDMKEYFKSEFAKLKSLPTLNEFNDIVKQYDLSWQKIFKGDFSGYEKGLSSRNMGDAFEKEFVSNFVNYADQLSEVLGIPATKLLTYEIKSVGGNNTKRPINISSNGIKLGNKPIQKIGDDVADVRLESDDYYNLSLKCGKKVTFCNTGVKQLFPFKKFDEFKETGELELSKDAEHLLNFFGLDKIKFASVFANYKNDGIRKSNSQKDEVDVTEFAKTNEFKNFLRSVVGCGYVLVHKMGPETHMYDLRTESDLDEFVGEVQSMVALYPSDGGKKAVDILLNTEGLTVLFNFRSKTGQVYPEHLMADYIIKKH